MGRQTSLCERGSCQQTQNSDRQTEHGGGEKSGEGHDGGPLDSLETLRAPVNRAIFSSSDWWRRALLLSGILEIHRWTQKGIRNYMRSTLVLCCAVLFFVLRMELHPALAQSEPPKFKALDGSVHDLHELRGHPAVVNFWATWCGPCKEEMPRLQKLADAYTPRGVAFIAISLDAPETREKIPSLIGKRGLRMPVWTGATDQTLAAFELGELVPATLVLDENGTVIGKIEGEMRDKDVQSRLDWLLAGRQGKQPKLVQKNDW